MSSDRVAVVTGAAGGIGLALVERFVAEGAAAVMADVDGARLAAEAARLRDAGAEVLDVVADVGDADAVDRLAARTDAAFGRVDVLCNNAGTIAFGPAWELALDAWEHVVRVNMMSVVHGVRAFVPIMRRSGDDGHVANVASMAAFMQLGGVAPYVATKHGVVGISIALAEDLVQAGSGISVTVACPDMVATGFGSPDGALPDDVDLPSGMISANEAASAIAEAMDARRFYAFTHAESIGTVEDRYRRVREGFEP